MPASFSKGDGNENIDYRLERLRREKFIQPFKNDPGW